VDIASLVPEGDAGLQIVTGTLAFSASTPAGDYRIETLDGEDQQDFRERVTAPTSIAAIEAVFMVADDDDDEEDEADVER